MTIAQRIFLLVLLSLVAYARAGHPERAGVGLLEVEQVRALAGPIPADEADAPDASVPFNRRRSLFVTDEAIVSEFSFAEVLTAIASADPTRTLTKETLFAQWMDTLMPAPGLGLGPNCQSPINGFRNSCRSGFDIPPTQELAFTGNPAFNFSAIALVNRFDLAGLPQEGATDCGEYRIVFARNSGKTDSLKRHLLIFEAVLPNPAPNGVDLSGCRPVAKFWARLSGISDQAERARRLKNFYFKGLPGFEPVVTARHYGSATPNAKGQIRSNAFINFANIPTTDWTLREFFVSLASARPLIRQTTAKTNPAELLFSDSDPHEKVLPFRTDFPRQVPSLSIDDINGFHMDTLQPKYNQPLGIETTEGQAGIDAIFSNRLRRSPLLAAAIQSRITEATLTPQNIADRAQALTCSGCHLFSNGVDLGGGLAFPSSMIFTHESERSVDMENSPDGGVRFGISPALENVFLKHRAKILKAFLGL